MKLYSNTNTGGKVIHGHGSNKFIDIDLLCQRNDGNDVLRERIAHVYLYYDAELQAYCFELELFSGQKLKHALHFSLSKNRDIDTLEEQGFDVA